MQSCSEGADQLSTVSKHLRSYFGSIWWLLVVSDDVGLSQSTQAILTKIPHIKIPLGGLKSKQSYLTILKLGSLRSRQQQIQSLVRTHFLVCRYCLLFVSLHDAGGKRENKLYDVSLIRTLIPPSGLHPYYLPKTVHPDTIPLRVRLSALSLWFVYMKSVTETLHTRFPCSVQLPQWQHQFRQTRQWTPTRD